MPKKTETGGYTQPKIVGSTKSSGKDVAHDTMRGMKRKAKDTG